MSVVLPELARRRSPNQSSRLGAAVHLIVVHRPVGAYASAIEWLCNPAAQASAHVITSGPDKATQLVGWDEKAWACMAFNAISDNIEVDDHAWAPARDAAAEAALAVAARIVAFRCHVRGIPPIWSHTTPHNTPGVCRHVDLGIAGGGHTDPTTDPALWSRFMALVKAEHKRGGFRPVWGQA